MRYQASYNNLNQLDEFIRWQELVTSFKDTDFVISE